jgi:hypothetical protein
MKEDRFNGQVAAIQQVLLLLGRKRFGPPAAAAIENTILAIHDLDRLERMANEVLVVSGWQELLETP